MRQFLPVSAPTACIALNAVRFTGRMALFRLSDAPRFADIFQQGNRWLNWLEKQPVQMSR
ncbi:hypothetical protein SD1617_5228, partial [Shigella dysenteriae 1617]